MAGGNRPGSASLWLVGFGVLAETNFSGLCGGAELLRFFRCGALADAGRLFQMAPRRGV
jgi:hypothetical protein